MKNSEESELEGWTAALFLEKVTSTAPSIIYIFNHQTQSNEYVNRSIGKSLGYTTKEIQAMGEALFLNLCHPDDLNLIGPYLDALCKMADNEVGSLEYRMKHKDGRWVWLLAYDTVFERDDSGTVIRHLGIATDITEQKAAQERAKAEQRIADAANDELQSFAYSVSHDMKAPSNTLHLLLSELKEQHSGSFDADAKEILDLSLKTVERMRVLIQDVLNYTHVIGQKIESTEVDLNKLFDDVVQDLRAEIRDSDARVLVQDLPTVTGCHTQLRILFQNLLANALKYQPRDGKPMVTVSSTVVDKDKTTFIHVKDNGIGIAPEYQHRIFEMFKRLHNKEDYSGTGLGLAICRRIAIRHSGDISVQSALGEGAVFTMSFKH